MPPVTIDGTSGITTPMYNGTITANAVTPVTGFKNRIINGACVISQRWGTSAVSDATNTNPYTVDRWSFYGDPASKVTLQQNQGSVTPPAGFINYMGLTSTSAYSPAAGDAFRFQQAIEGLNIADLAWGTASAKTVTLSFWVRSSLTGTFGGALSNDGLNRSYPYSYTISAANTWEQKSVTIAGDTTGTWLTTNGIGIRVFFDVGCGTNTKGTAGAWASAFYAGVTGGTNVVATNGATFQFTGVQLEVGSTATSFDYRPYGTELALCQRYYVEFPASSQMAAYTSSATEIVGTVNLPVQMRATPAVTSGGGSKYGWYDTNYNSSSSNTVSMATTGSLATYAISQAGFGSLTTLRSRVLQSDSAYKFSAEL
jgi:hypothetical protein